MNNEKENNDNLNKEHEQATELLLGCLSQVTQNEYVLSSARGGIAAFMIGRIMAIPPQLSIAAGLVFGAYQGYQKAKNKKESENVNTPL